MSTTALLLVLCAALVHASWNFLLKRSGGGTAFVWWFAAASAVIYAPVAIAIMWYVKPVLGATHYALIAASAILHTAYYLLLDRGYRSGDLSLVYPLARGSAPLITVLCAVLLLGESPSALAVGGAVLIGMGALMLTGGIDHLRRSGSLPAVGYALLTGCMIASYTLVDKVAVGLFLIPPLIQDWATNVGRVVLMTPMALQQRHQLLPTWRRCYPAIIAVAILCPLSYILVLSAMVFTPVSYIAPAREISILVAALLGTQLLAEGNTAQRIAAAAAMVVGIVFLAVG
jgi:drug/metabolite transporter (DMT)-like permease